MLSDYFHDFDFQVFFFKFKIVDIFFAFHRLGPHTKKIDQGKRSKNKVTYFQILTFNDFFKKFPFFYFTSFSAVWSV